MTLVRDEGGRKILEGTVHVAIVFSEEGDVYASFSSRGEEDVKKWADKLLKETRGLGLPDIIAKYTVATYREMV